MLNLIEDVFMHASPVPESVSRYPAMLGPGDRSLYYYAAQSFYKFQGRIVDAGVFLGGTTNALIEGMKDNKNYPHATPHKISVYDRFLVSEPPYQNFILKNTGKKLELTDSFQNIFSELLGDNTSHIEIFPGDFLAYTYPYDFIEILGLDLCKSKDLTFHCAREFFPKMQPFKSIAIHQDYVHMWTPWIHVTMEALARYFIKTAEIDISALFVCSKTPSLSDINIALDRLSDYEEALRLMDCAIAKVQTPRAHFALTLAKAKLIADLRSSSDAAMECLTSASIAGYRGSELPSSDRHGLMYQQMKAYIEKTTATASA